MGRGCCDGIGEEGAARRVAAHTSRCGGGGGGEAAAGDAASGDAARADAAGEDAAGRSATSGTAVGCDVAGGGTSCASAGAASIAPRQSDVPGLMAGPPFNCDGGVPAGGGGCVPAGSGGGATLASASMGEALLRSCCCGCAWLSWPGVAESSADAGGRLG